jgi:hypothetical protein
MSTTYLANLRKDRQWTVMRYRSVVAGTLLALLASGIAYAGEGDPGTGIGGSGSPSSQPVARKQAGPYGHCSHDAAGRAYCWQTGRQQ